MKNKLYSTQHPCIPPLSLVICLQSPLHASSLPNNYTSYNRSGYLLLRGAERAGKSACKTRIPEADLAANPKSSE